MPICFDPFNYMQLNPTRWYFDNHIGTSALLIHVKLDTFSHPFFSSEFSISYNVDSLQYVTVHCVFDVHYCSLCIWFILLFIVYLVYNTAHCLFGLYYCSLFIWFTLLFIVYLIYITVHCLFDLHYCSLFIWCVNGVINTNTK